MKQSVRRECNLPKIMFSDPAIFAVVGDEGIGTLVGQEILLVSAEVVELPKLPAFAGFDEC